MTYHSDIRKFFELNYNDLTRMALHIIKAQVSADVVAEQISQFYIVAQRVNLIGRYDPAKSKLITYIYTALRNSITEYLFSKRKGVFVPLPDDLMAKGTPDDRDTAIDLKSFLPCLPELEQELARRLITSTVTEIAKKQKCTVANISIQRSRIRAKWALHLSC